MFVAGGSASRSRAVGWPAVNVTRLCLLTSRHITRRSPSAARRATTLRDASGYRFGFWRAIARSRICVRRLYKLADNLAGAPLRPF
jgi:hypothetical protein